MIPQIRCVSIVVVLVAGFLARAPIAAADSNAYWAAVIADEPLSYWPLDDAGPTVADVIDSNDGTAVGVWSHVPNGPGGIAGAMRLDGDPRSGVNVGGDALRLAPVTGSVEAWVRTDASIGPYYRTILRWWNYGYELRVEPDGRPAFGLWYYQHATGAYTGYGAFGSDAINDAGWHHVVGTWDADTLKLYVDGVLANETATSGVPFYGPWKNVNIGRPCDSCDTRYWPGFLGDIAQVAVYNTALSAARVTVHYETAMGGPTCGNGRIEGDESCDDGDHAPVSGDGCSGTCTIERGFGCSGEPSICTSIFGRYDVLWESGASCRQPTSPSCSAVTYPKAACQLDLVPYQGSSRKGQLIGRDCLGYKKITVTLVLDEARNVWIPARDFLGNVEASLVRYGGGVEPISAFDMSLDARDPRLRGSIVSEPPLSFGLPGPQCDMLNPERCQLITLTATRRLECNAGSICFWSDTNQLNGAPEGSFLDWYPGDPSYRDDDSYKNNKYDVTVSDASLDNTITFVHNGSDKYLVLFNGLKQSGSCVCMGPGEKQYLRPFSFDNRASSHELLDAEKLPECCGARSLKASCGPYFLGHTGRVAGGRLHGGVAELTWRVIDGSSGKKVRIDDITYGISDFNFNFNLWKGLGNAVLSCSKQGGGPPVCTPGSPDVLSEIDISREDHRSGVEIVIDADPLECAPSRVNRTCPHPKLIERGKTGNNDIFSRYPGSEWQSTCRFELESTVLIPDLTGDGLELSYEDTHHVWVYFVADQRLDTRDHRDQAYCPVLFLWDQGEFRVGGSEGSGALDFSNPIVTEGTDAIGAPLPCSPDRLS